ncbi:MULTISPECIES: hypothetical protein [unclassified Nitrobacter]|uniref:hypothetical protein n=1 Tax=unclassified Nitrobacter TaxID=2620411 RepID=UPI000929EEEA|nr:MULTISPECIES: hypothetical protein [unclassified Nitrobacter]MBN9147016.1 hypothetical protein [Nitrobacter sp.]OJV02856.1 MAG: hypothetical protein BGO16_00040 [Nitrobacter sp. 62-23]
MPSGEDVDALVERLRQDAEMLGDGYQRNLTELWHGVVVKDAAKACVAAAELIESQSRALSDAAAEWDALDQSHRSIGEQLGREGRRRIAAETRLKEAEKMIELIATMRTDNSEHAELIARARAFLNSRRV